MDKSSGFLLEAGLLPKHEWASSTGLLFQDIHKDGPFSNADKDQQRSFLPRSNRRKKLSGLRISHCRDVFPTKILSSKELKVLVGETTQTRRLSGIPCALSPGIPTRGWRCVTFSNILKKRSGVSSSPVVTYLHILRSPTSALLLGKPRTGLMSPEIQFLTCQDGNLHPDNGRL